MPSPRPLPPLVPLAARTIFLAAALHGLAAAAGAQRPAASAAAQFRQFDASGNGYLSGTEIDACGCRAYDADGDGRITEAEYLKGRGADAPVAAAAGPFAVGARVRAGCYGSTQEGIVERVDGDRRWVRFDPTQSSCDGWRGTDQLEAAAAAPGTRGGSYAAGAPVEALLNGRWQTAVVLAAAGGRYQVHYESYGAAMDRWVDASDVRQTPERARHRTGSGGAVPPGEYGCYAYSAGAGLRYQTGFSITGPGTYADVDGARGTFAKDAAGIVRFRGGALGGSQGDFQYNAGRAMIYMHVPSSPGRRAGMDCEGPRP